MRRPMPQVGLNFEYLMWIFTRISALALICLALMGIIGAFIMGARTQLDIGALFRWTFFPIPFHVVNSNIPDVTQGWVNAYWQVLQLLIVFFGASHGMNGLRVVIEDYLGPSWLRPFFRGLVFCLWLFVLIVAVFVILQA